MFIILLSLNKLFYKNLDISRLKYFKEVSLYKLYNT